MVDQMGEKVKPPTQMEPGNQSTNSQTAANERISIETKDLDFYYNPTAHSLKKINMKIIPSLYDNLLFSMSTKITQKFFFKKNIR